MAERIEGWLDQDHYVTDDGHILELFQCSGQLTSKRIPPALVGELTLTTGRRRVGLAQAVQESVLAAKERIAGR